MCEATVTVTFYTCGDSISKVTIIEECADKDKPGHQVKKNNMGSSRARHKCGKSDCRNP